MVRTIAITGGIGSGKSAFAAAVRSLGYVVLDADVLAREVLFEDSVANAVQGLFGNEVFLSRGVLDRDRVRKMVFANPSLRQSLEAIIHPAVIARFERCAEALAQLSPDAWIFYEIPLLFEAGREGDFDAVVSVMATEEVRRDRVATTRGLSAGEFDRIVATQVSDQVRREKAHLLVDNSAGAEVLLDRALEVTRALQARFARSGS